VTDRPFTKVLSASKLPSLLVFLLLLAVAHTEIPELIHLSDDVSNDFGATSFGCQYVEVRPVNDANTAFSANAMTLATFGTVGMLCFSPEARPFQDAGKEIPYLSSVLRT
jgi:hypothetical protein